MNYDKIYQDFIGKDKIQPLTIKKGPNGTWILRYKEGTLTRQIECEDRNVLDQILVEFGGKNPETCKTEGKFLELTNKSNSEALNELGHRITKIFVTGQRVTRQKTFPIGMPTGTGTQGTIQSKKIKKDEINLILKDREEVTFTRVFSAAEEFDNLVEFIFSQESLKDLKWYVRKLGTESRETQKQCLWVRLKAGDGTKSMVLELHELDGTFFTDCTRQDLFDAAGDMFDAPCKRVKVRKKKDLVKDICLFAAEDGKIDLNGFEAVV